MCIKVLGLQYAWSLLSAYRIRRQVSKVHLPRQHVLLDFYACAQEIEILVLLILFSRASDEQSVVAAN